jgi:DNA-binding transcriptional LysR family regulator
LSVSDPDLRVALHDIGRQQSIQLLLDGVIDFAVMVEAPALAQLERQSIGTSYFVAAFAPSSPLCGQSRVGWADLAPHPLILAGDLRQRGLLQSMWEGAGADLRPAYEVEELATGAGLAAQGLGYVLLPNVLVTPQTMPRLRSARLDCPQLVRPLEVVHLRSRPLLPQAHSLVEALRAAAARLAD